MTTQHDRHLYTATPDDRLDLHPDAYAASRLWRAAINTYIGDARRPWSQNGDKGEALADLRTTRALLTRICDPLGFDADVVGDAIERWLAGSCPGGKQDSKRRRRGGHYGG